MNKRRQGFTLVEVILSMVLFVLVMLAALGMATTTLRFWAETTQRRLGQQNVRMMIDTVTAEVRQAIPDPDPSGTGYLSIIPPVSPTGILLPNVNAPTGSTLTFTLPDAAGYDPSTPGFNPADPSHYRRVRYYLVPVSGVNRELHRQEIRYNSAGGVLMSSDALVAQASPQGALGFAVTSLGPATVQISVSASEAVNNSPPYPYVYSVLTTVSTVGL